MKFKTRFTEQIVGTFILIAVVGVAVVLIFIGVNQRWFARNYYFSSNFYSGDGLSVGMPITLKGFEIGKVEKIDLTDDNRVDINFYVYDTYYHKIVPNSVLELASSTFGLGGGLKFHPGRSDDPPLEEFSFILSLDMEEGQLLVKKGLVDLSEDEDMIGSLLGNLDPILEEIQSTLSAIKILVVSLDDAIKGKEGSPVGGILTDLHNTSSKINVVLDDTSSRLNTLLDLTGSRIDSVLGQLEKISTDIEKTTSTIGDSQGLAKRLLDPSGSLATILDDNNELYDRIDNSIGNLDETVLQLKDFVGFINSSQPQITGILEEGKSVLDEGKDVIEAVKTNPLIRGGIPQPQEQPTTFSSYRDEDF